MVTKGQLDLDRDFLSQVEWGSIEKVRLLIAAGADIEARTEHGDTALQRAVIRNRLGMVELLIALGADVNAKYTGEGGGTALTLAVRSERLAITKCLLDAGADTEVRDAKGETPLMYATRPKSRLEAKAPRPSIIALLKSHPGCAKDLSDRLISSGFGPETTEIVMNWDYFGSHDLGYCGASEGLPSLRDPLRKILKCLRYEPDGAIEAYGFYAKGQAQHFCGNARSACAALCEDDRLGAADLAAKWNEVLRRPGAEWTTWRPRKYPQGPVWELFFQPHLGNRRRVMLNEKRLVVTRIEDDLFECVLEPLPLLEDASRENAQAEITELLAKLSKNAATEAEGMSQAERGRIADTFLGAFIMGAQVIAHKHGLSRSELDGLLLKAHAATAVSTILAISRR